MRSSLRRALTLGAIATTALIWSGCDAKKQTEYVAGVSTQVQVPRDLKAIRVDVSVGGVIQFCRGYRVYDGKVQLPRSLGELPATGKPGPDPITVTVSGFTEEFSETTGKDVFDNCTSVAPKIGDEKQGTRILRRSRQPYVLDSVLFLPMALRYSCYDKDCEKETDTCKGGKCVDAKVDESKLPKYSDDLIDGLGSNCFSASQCFAAGVPAVVVDSNDCTYALPNTPSAPKPVPGAPPIPLMSPGDGINVEVTYDGGLNREILDKDPEEGFTIPDPGKPQRFRLAPGLCELVKGVDDQGKDTAHRITAIRASGLCRAKGPFQPLCANDQLAAMGTPDGVSGNVGPAACTATELKSAKSVLMIIADDTDHNKIFYTGGGGGAGSGELAQSDLVSGALVDPAFKHTFIGLSFFPGGAGTACTGHTTAVEPQIATVARPAIVTQFTAFKAGGLKDLTALENVRGALEDAYAKLKNPDFADANRRAVLVIGNKGLEVNACGGTPAQGALAARTTDKIETYVALLARDADPAVPDSDPPPLAPGAIDLANAGRVQPPGNTDPLLFDARKDKNDATRLLRAIVDDLGTCAYEVTANPGDGAVLSYSDPIALPGPQKATYTIPHDAACTPENTAGNGWSYKETTVATSSGPKLVKRVHVCGAACASYRSVLKSAAGFGAAFGQPSLAVPLFSHKAGCGPK